MSICSLFLVSGSVEPLSVTLLQQGTNAGMTLRYRTTCSLTTWRAVKYIDEEIAREREREREIYIYMKLLTGLSLALLMVINWSK